MKQKTIRTKNDVMFSFLFFKAAAFNAESEPIKVATIVKGRDAAQAYCEVLDHVASVIVHPTPQKKQHLTVLSKKVAHSVGELVKSAEELKGIYIVIIFLFIYLFILSCFIQLKTSRDASRFYRVFPYSLKS